MITPTSYLHFVHNIGHYYLIFPWTNIFFLIPTLLIPSHKWRLGHYQSGHAIIKEINKEAKRDLVGVPNEHHGEDHSETWTTWMRSDEKLFCQQELRIIKSWIMIQTLTFQRRLWRFVLWFIKTNIYKKKSSMPTQGHYKSYLTFYRHSKFYHYSIEQSQWMPTKNV